MPHCIIEYSHAVAEQVSIDELMATVHQATFESGLFDEYDIKTRAIDFLHHRTGQTQDLFVHVTVRLLSGRDDDQKSSLAEKILGQIEPMLPGVESVGVEICDMHRESYQKRVLS